MEDTMQDSQELFHSPFPRTTTTPSSAIHPTHRVPSPRVSQTRQSSYTGRHRHALLSLVITLGLLLALSQAATAGTLTTPTLFQGSGQNVCIAINVGNQPLTVTVEIVGFFGGGNEDTCALQPGNPEGCQAFHNGAGYCKVTAAGTNNVVRQNVRAVMMNRNTTAPFTINATVEAR
jgi:hypothetical protein